MSIHSKYNKNNKYIEITNKLSNGEKPSWSLYMPKNGITNEVVCACNQCSQEERISVVNGIEPILEQASKKHRCCRMN